MQLLAETHVRVLQPSAIAHISAISACGGSGEWERALALFAALASRLVVPDAASFNAALTACGDIGQWARALALVSQMRSSSLRVGVAPLTSAISACGVGRQWRRILAILRSMRCARVQPNAICVQAVAHGLDRAGAPLLAEAVQRKLGPCALHRLSQRRGTHACQRCPSLVAQDRCARAGLAKAVVSSASDHRLGILLAQCGQRTQIGEEDL